MEKKREPAEPRIHESIDDLCRSGFFGEITLYFQNGNIESIRKTERIGKKEFIDRHGEDESKKARVLVVSKRREGQTL